MTSVGACRRRFCARSRPLRRLTHACQLKFLLVRRVRPLDFAVKLGSSSFDIGMADTQIFDMPVELGLELVAIAY